MSEATHTPGPWHWGRVHPSCDCPDGIKDDGALTLLGAASEAVLTGIGGEGAGGGWWDVDVSDANARLIASSPDLLAACKEAILQIEYLHGKFQATGTGEAVLEKLRVAIEKATGKKGVS